MIWQSTSYELRVESLKARIEIQKCELKSTSYEFKSSSYESNQQKNRSMKTEVNGYRNFIFSKIISPKMFGNSCGKSYVQFLMIISCFKFPLLHNCGFSRKLIQ